MDNRLLDLLDAYLENRLSEGEAEELRDALRASPEARRDFWEYVEQHALIEDVLAEARGRDLALAEEGAVAPGENEPTVSMPRSRRFPAWGWGLGALAASVLLLLLLLPRVGPDAPSRSHEADAVRIVELLGVAELIAPTGAATPVRVGQDLAAGQSLRTGEEESSAVIEYPDRTRLTLGPGTTLTLADAPAGGKRVSFTGGSLLADVPPQPDGLPMIVAGPQGEVRVSDTRFLLASAAPDSSRLELAKGRGELLAGRDRPMLLDAGNVALVNRDAGEVVVRPMPAAPTEPRAEVDFKGLQSVAFSSDGKTVLASTSYQAIFWDGQGRLEAVPLFKNRWDGLVSAWSPDGTVLALGNHRSRQMMLWDLATRDFRRALAMPEGVPNEFVVAPEGRWVAARHPKESRVRLQVWDGRTGEERDFPRLDPTIGALASSPDGRWLAVGRGDMNTSDRNSLLLLDAATGKQEVSLPVRIKAIGGMAFSPDGRLIAFGLRGQIQIWDITTHTHVRTIRGHERHVRALVFSPDGKALAGATHEGPVWVWGMEDGRELAIFNVPPLGARALAFSPDGRSLAVVQAKGGALQLWDIPQTP